MKTLITTLLALVTLTASAQALETETFKTSKGELKIFLIKHATFYFTYNGHTIYVDPLTEYADFSKLPKADMILITHDHSDHYDLQAIKQLRQKSTIIVTNKTVGAQLKSLQKSIKTLQIASNGDKFSFLGIDFTAVPSYNTTQTQFHPKGRDNGFILLLGDFSFWIPGDCEDMPELRQFPKIDLAMIPVNQPYTMTIEQAVKAVRMVNPKYVIPIHLGDTDQKALEEALLHLRGTKTLMHNM